MRLLLITDGRGIEMRDKAKTCYLEVFNLVPPSMFLPRLAVVVQAANICLNGKVSPTMAFLLCRGKFILSTFMRAASQRVHDCAES